MSTKSSEKKGLQYEYVGEGLLLFNGTKEEMIEAIDEIREAMKRGIEEEISQNHDETDSELKFVPCSLYNKLTIVRILQRCELCDNKKECQFIALLEDYAEYV